MDCARGRDRFVLSLPMMNVQVTGASGFVGSALVTALRRTPAKLFLPRELTIAAGMVPGVSTVIHLAARVHVMHDDAQDPLAAFREINVDATLNLAAQAASAGVRRFVFLSSVKVNGEATAVGRAFTERDTPSPHDPYAQSKWEAEQGLRHIAANTDMEVVIIRPPLVYGPGVKANFAALVRAVESGWPLPLGAVNNIRSLVALDNLVDFTMTCATHPAAADQTFLISDGQDLSTPDLIRAIARAVGVRPRLFPVPLSALQFFGRVSGKGAAVERLCGNLQLDNSKARELLGWVAPIGVDEALRRSFARGHL